MIIVSFVEVFIVGAVLPFLGVLTAPEKIFAQNLAQPFIQLLQTQSALELLLPFSLILLG